MSDGFVTDELDMEDYLSWEGIEFKKSSGSSGVQLHVRECPHVGCGNDKWKVYLNADSGLGNCFACDSKFNKWSFIKARCDDDPKKTFAHIVEIKKALGHNVTVKKRAVVTVEVVENLELPPSIALPTPDGNNSIYLEKRGITAEYAGYFHLRYCHEGWHTYTKEDGTRGGQNCSLRIVIPIYSLEGELKTFQARDTTGEAEIRYLFPAKLPGTGRYLYNGQNAYAAAAREIIVNEGPFDVFATKRVIDRFDDMRGIVPIGTFGKHLSVSADGGEDQYGAFMKLKRRGLQRVTIMWDGEHDAFSAALRAGEVLWKKLGLEVWIAILPQGKDPDEADQYEVYKAWRDAFKLTALSLAKHRIRNPYTKKDKNPLDLSVDTIIHSSSTGKETE